MVVTHLGSLSGFAVPTRDMMARMATRSSLLVPVLSLLLLVVSCSQTRAEEHPDMMSQRASDTRKPLPLPAMMAEHQKQNMREHLAAVQAIIAAIGRDDMDAAHHHRLSQPRATPAI